MRRRIALATALALTTVTVFGLIAVGMRGGLFGSTDAGEIVTAAETQDDVAPALQYLAAVGAQQAPDVMTEYVYVDAPADPPQVTYVTRAGQPAAESRPQDAVAPSPDNPVAEPTEPEEPSPTIPRPDPTAPAPLPAPDDDGGGGTDDEDGSPSGEDEFEGTVSAISGDVVTFDHGGELTAARVTDPSALSIGMRVKVHVIRVGGGWVAKEIEIEG